MCLLSFASPSSAGEIRKLDLERTDEGFYLINVELQVEASKQKIIKLLTDYNHLTRLNSQILESELIELNDAGISVVRTKVRPCGYLFCKTISQTQNLQRLEDSSISATIIPEESDFLEGKANWSFRGEGGQVSIYFNARLLPRFWVPPLINLWVMRQMLENEMLETIINLEKLQLR